MDITIRMSIKTRPIGDGDGRFIADSISECPVCNPTGKSGKTTTTTKSSKVSSKFGKRKLDNVVPWTEPNDDDNYVELLVNDPGVWAVNDFLDIEEVNKLKHLLQKHGDQVGDSPCGVPDGRKCYWFTAADGLTNNNYYDEEDSKFFMQIKAKIQALWPQFNIRDGTGVYVVPEGKTDPYIPPYHAGVSMDTSDDKYWPATTIIYLEDGDGEGGDTIFPYAGSDGLVVKPKRVMAVTWLIMHADGKVNENHGHGFQATTPESKKKLLMTQNHYISSEELYTLLG